MTPPLTEVLAAVELPELPEPQGTMNWTREAGVIIGKPENGYTAEQMHEYGEACRTLKPGSVVVPVEPTEAMIEAGMVALCDSIGGYEYACVTKCYRAMLAAAQPPARGVESFGADFVRSIEP